MRSTTKILMTFGFALGLALAGCPGPQAPPKQPEACEPITEDDPEAPEHCADSKEQCEKVLSETLTAAHEGRCGMPPCSSFSAWATCEPTGEECQYLSGEWGLVFRTTEHVRCR